MVVSRAISLGLMLSMAGLLWGGLNLTVGGSIGALNGWSSSAQWRFEEYSKPVSSESRGLWRLSLLARRLWSVARSSGRCSRCCSSVRLSLFPVTG